MYITSELPKIFNKVYNVPLVDSINLLIDEGYQSHYNKLFMRKYSNFVEDKLKTLRVGMIVVVKNPLYSPLDSSSISKIVAIKKNSNNNILVEYGSNNILVELNKSTAFGPLVLLEDLRLQKYIDFKYLNKPVVYESIFSIHPATTEQKKMYKTFKNKILYHEF